MVTGTTSTNRVSAAARASESVKKQKRSPAEKRKDLRETLWPGSEVEIWDRQKNDGFVTLPRILPLVLDLLDELNPRGNPCRVYIALCCRNYDEGIISLVDIEALAFEAGYKGSRAVRTCNEHLLTLMEHGLIKVKPNGIREFGHIMIVNPLLVFARLKAQNKVSPALWGAFANRASEVGAKIPTLSE